MVNINAQNWLNEKYPKNRRNEIAELDISKDKITSSTENFSLGGLFGKGDKVLTNSLKLEGFTSLRIFKCAGHGLISLDVSDCKNLEELDCNSNKLINLALPEDASSLKKLRLQSNEFHQDLFFLEKTISLEELWLNNNKFTGSLECLNLMKELRKLDISNTDINSGLECIPRSVEDFYFSADAREDAKVKAIYNFFANEQGVVETDEDRRVKNFSERLQEIKQKLQEINRPAQIWKLNYIELKKVLNESNRKINSLNQLNEGLEKKLEQKEQTIKTLGVFLQDYIEMMEERITDLEEIIEYSGGFHIKLTEEKKEGRIFSEQKEELEKKVREGEKLKKLISGSEENKEELEEKKPYEQSQELEQEDLQTQTIQQNLPYYQNSGN